MRAAQDVSAGGRGSVLRGRRPIALAALLLHRHHRRSCPVGAVGLTSQSVAGRRHALALRISPSGTRLTRFLYSLNVRCGRDSYLSGDAPRYNLPIRANGRVSDVHRYSFRVGRRVIGRFTERFTATVGSTGASVTLSVKGRYIYRPTGQAFRHCRTGTVKWVAAL